MFRLLLPCVQGTLVREADEVDLVTVLACVGFDRDESRNLLDELVHAPGCLPVRFGQETQRLPSGGRAFFQDRNRAARSARVRTNAWIMSTRPSNRSRT